MRATCIMPTQMHASRQMQSRQCNVLKQEAHESQVTHDYAGLYERLLVLVNRSMAVL